MQQPKSGEWWGNDDGDRACFSVLPDGTLVSKLASFPDGTSVSKSNNGEYGFNDFEWEGWHHLPDCTGWDWKPKVRKRVPVRLWVLVNDNDSGVLRSNNEPPGGWTELHSGPDGTFYVEVSSD